MDKQSHITPENQKKLVEQQQPQKIKNKHKQQKGKKVLDIPLFPQPEKRDV